MPAADQSSMAAGCAAPRRHKVKAHGRQKAAISSISALGHQACGWFKAIHTWAATEPRATAAHSRGCAVVIVRIRPRLFGNRAGSAVAVPAGRLAGRDIEHGAAVEEAF